MQKLSLLGVIGFLFLQLSCSYGRAQAVSSDRFRTGTFRPAASSTAFTWQVTASNALNWNHVPYVPVGVAFTPVSFKEGSPSAWHSDEAYLDALKAHGITDVLITPPDSLVDVSPSALQRLIDAMEARGLHYGIGFGRGLEQPLTGFEVRPAVYRFDDPNRNVALWQVSDAEAAAYFVVDAAADSRLIGAGMATINRGVASISLDDFHGTAHPVALLVPLLKLHRDADGVGLPDVWGEFDAYRDRLLDLLRQVHFGAGLRFFLDPLGPTLGFSDEALFMVPNSEMFRISWESYLSRKYGAPDALTTKWQLSKSFSSLREMARLIPLWSLGRGFPYFYDPTTGNTYRVTQPTLSTWWDDFSDWRTQTLRYALKTIADELQRYVADVPVVYSGGLQSLSNVSLDDSSPPDGLAATFSPAVPPSLNRSMAPLYSLASLSRPPRWLIGVPAITAGSYASYTDLVGQLASLQNLGFKGFFVTGVTLDHLDWIERAAQALTDSPIAALRTPRVLYYPFQAPGPAFTGQVPGDESVFWVPAPVQGILDDWWPSFSGYTIHLPSGAETVLVSLLGPRVVRLQVPDPHVARAFTPDGAPVPIKIVGKDLIEVHFANVPLVFTGVGESPIPTEAATDAVTLVTMLLPHASKADRALGELQRDQAQMLLRRKDYLGAYTAVRPAVEGLAAALSPYIWIEGENPALDNFTETAQNAGASGGAYLRLSTPEEPLQIIHEYAARYTFDVSATGDYDIWLAGTVPGPQTSPFTWYIDHQPPQPPATATPVGPRYLSGYFGWIYLGRASLSQGSHALSIKIADPASETKLYTFSIDALLITPSSLPFTPRTTIRPVPLLASDMPKFLKTIGVEAK
ncbi:hypothetical protein CTKA_00473 [Chthonomonas calidirosea]|uniref:Uncharacterized protein n=1 Tax=Chthonomonas calidirosea (strain DSM 23976 / ICMP 18418 / T49) TaxID=1303518 RepID=S0EVT9_CHTCT|nr:hypothetical protein [Chthonomonas calidirosea]CCW34507.1 hypothetical protein CCALI_00682 [Chthonomonas calidirosea T49]CEK14585.1 hypothetical protein CTKA_00473 [Chthonomonas calidirosea]